MYYFSAFMFALIEVIFELYRRLAKNSSFRVLSDH